MRAPMALIDSTALIDDMSVATYTIPTDKPESDGTLEWSSTTLVLVRVHAAGHEGIGYSYADKATAHLIADRLIPLLERMETFAIPDRWHDMVVAIRNLGRPGICSMAISAVDNALWDLKAKALGVSLSTLLGRAHASIPVYGSGGFTSYSLAELEEQLSGWAREGFTMAKMKIGRAPDADVDRVRAASQVMTPLATLFVDANGAYTRKEALRFAERFAEFGVTWFEEPVSSDDLEGLRLLRDRGPGGMAISAGEYGYDLPYFRRMLEAGAVDVLQADATRCGGITGFLGVAALCEAFGVPLSSHCAPSLHLPLCCACRPAIHLEWFHDHARIERMLFDGARRPERGLLIPDDSRPGLGLEFKESDAECYRD